MYNKGRLHESIVNLPYGFTSPYKLFDITKDNLGIIQRLSLQRKLPVHNGCVNSICWNKRGDYILSGSDDQHLCVTHGHNYNVLADVQTGHKANIFSARFLPNTSDNHVVSCSGDGIVIFTDLQKPETSFKNVFNCHFGTAYEVITAPNDSHTFLSCGEDGTVRWFDLRIKNNCSAEECKEDILINFRCAVTTLAINPLMPYHLGIGCSDSSVRIFDRRMLGTKATGSYAGNGIQAMISRFTVSDFDGGTHRITSLSYNADGTEMLVSYSSDYIYLFNVKDSDPDSHKILQTGTRAKARTMDGRSRTDRHTTKRLRVKGDWSDTGPNARPESENPTGRDQHSRPLHVNLLQRMSDVLTRMFNNTAPGRSQENAATAAGAESAVAGSSEPATCSSEASEHISDTVAEESKVVAEGPSTLEEDETNETGFSMEDTSVLDATSESPSVTQSIQEMNEEIRSTRQRGSAEPIFTLTFSGQGAQSGTISINPHNLLCSSSQPITTFETVDEENITAVSPQSVDTLAEFVPAPELVQSVESNEATNRVDENVPSTSFQSVPPMETEYCHDDFDEEEEDHDIDDVGPTDVPESEERSKRRRSLPCLGATSSASSGSSQSDSKYKSKLSALLRAHRIGKEAPDINQQMNVPSPSVKYKYVGHRNARTMIKEATFWGEHYIMSGSDCGHIFVWDKDTTNLVMLMEADHHVVNCLQPHPFDPILASSGIDYDIKLWAPLKEEPLFDEQRAIEIMERNKVMLEETKDTITVPASFMIRMLASLNDLRNAGSGGSIWRRVARQVRDSADQL